MITKTNPLLARLQVDPQFAADGSLAVCSVQAFFGQNIVDDSTTPPTVTPLPWPAPTVIDCIAQAAKTIIYDGATYTYGELARAMAAAAEQERLAAAEAPPAE